jgi:predicted ArsR family transcriptional regulator
VSAFVLYFAEQERRHACTPWFDMPMKREDIADYLGTATETVCRCFRQLAEERLVEFENVHRARIRDAAALTAYADAS